MMRLPTKPMSPEQSRTFAKLHFYHRAFTVAGQHRLDHMIATKRMKHNKSKPTRSAAVRLSPRDRLLSVFAYAAGVPESSFLKCVGNLSEVGDMRDDVAVANAVLRRFLDYAHLAWLRQARVLADENVRLKAENYNLKAEVAAVKQALAARGGQDQLPCRTSAVDDILGAVLDLRVPGSVVPVLEKTPEAPCSTKVHPEPKEWSSYPPENCTKCRQPTRYWLTPHTPLCPDCASQMPKGQQSTQYSTVRLPSGHTLVH